MNDDIKKIIDLKIQKSFATLDDAEFLILNKKFHIAVNRIYYAVFYMVSAFAVKDGFETSKHKQLIGWFNKYYVSSLKVDKNNAKVIIRLFEERNKADYDIYATFTKEQTEELFNSTKILLLQLESIINQ